MAKPQKLDHYAQAQIHNMIRKKDIGKVEAEKKLQFVHEPSAKPIKFNA